MPKPRTPEKVHDFRVAATCSGVAVSWSAPKFREDGVPIVKPLGYELYRRVETDVERLNRLAERGRQDRGEKPVAEKQPESLTGSAPASETQKEHPSGDRASGAAGAAEGKQTGDSGLSRGIPYGGATQERFSKSKYDLVARIPAQGSDALLAPDQQHHYFDAGPDEGFELDRQYYYAIRPYSNPLSPGDVSRVRAVLYSRPPRQVSDLSLTLLPEGIALAWTAPGEDCAGEPISFSPTYRVYRSESGSDQPVTLLAEGLEDASYLDQEAPRRRGEDFYFVVACDPGRGTDSERVRIGPVTWIDSFAPSPPAELTAVTAPGEVRLLWTDAPAADLAGYRVYRRGPEGDALLTDAPVSSCTFVDSTLRPGLEYVYWVTALDRATPPNESVPSPQAKVTAAAAD